MVNLLDKGRNRGVTRPPTAASVRTDEMVSGTDGGGGVPCVESAITDVRLLCVPMPSMTGCQ